MKLKSLLLAALFLGVSTSAGASSMAWWLTKSYHPADTEIEGIPVARINPDWVAAKVLTRNTFSPEELADAGEEDGPVWSIERDINGDGKTDRAIVGVAKTASGDLQRFLLVLTQAPGGEWREAYVHLTETDPDNYDMGFSYLTDSGSAIQWNDCFSCDSGLGELTWPKGKFSMW